MTSNNLCAAYARVSSDRQNPLSPTDQVRKCREFADSNTLIVLEDHIYMDEDSGVGSDRPAFQRLLNAALSPGRPFNTILVDDTSRLSRSQWESMRTIEKLKFAGVRVVFISQGIDTDSEQSDVQMTVHGLVDSLYVKELAKKTHRGLESCALQGLHTGGRCFGYSTVAVGEGESRRLVVNETEAAVVKEIFEMFATGLSLKKIAKCLNSKCVPSPRSSRSRNRGTWCPTAIRAMLKRELYKGEIVWNRSKFVKVPGTNKRRSKPRPESEWKRLSAPELTIVSNDLWNSAQSRFKSLGDAHTGQDRRGLLHRSLTSPYLFSGLLKCGVCGINLIIASGGGKKPKYVCSGYFNRGTCSNKLYIRQDELEERLLSKLRAELLQPEEIEFAIEIFGRQLRSSLASVSSKLGEMRSRKEKLEREIHNFTRAIAENGHSKYIIEEIAVREKEISGITDRLLSSTPDSIEAQIGEVRRLVEEGIQTLQSLSKLESSAAKEELHSHLSAVRMYPSMDGEGWYYIAEGAWDLLGTDPLAPHVRVCEEGRIRMVAGGGFEPPIYGL
jgi:DNA invertase Pin-like site-specific DNA recombinase